MTGIYLISQERERQIAEEGFTAEHDAAHTNNELSWAAVHWAMPDSVKMDQGGIDVHIYPELFALKASYGRKPIRFNRWQGDRIKQLVYAGALVAAEIDRLLVDQPKPNIAEIFSELREKFGHCFDDIGDPLEFQRRMRDGDEVVDLRKQLAEVQERLKWQPIETAPKDGEKILISVRGSSFLAYWHTLIQAWDTAYGSTMDTDHWMPLPPAPEADNAG